MDHTGRTMLLSLLYVYSGLLVANAESEPCVPLKETINENTDGKKGDIVAMMDVESSGMWRLKAEIDDTQQDVSDLFATRLINYYNSTKLVVDLVGDLSPKMKTQSIKITFYCRADGTDKEFTRTFTTSRSGMVKMKVEFGNDDIENVAKWIRKPAELGEALGDAADDFAKESEMVADAIREPEPLGTCRPENCLCTWFLWLLCWLLYIRLRGI